MCALRGRQPGRLKSGLFCVTSFRTRGCTPCAIVVAKSARLRFRLAAKTALTPLLLLSPQNHAILRGPLMAIPVYFAIGAIC